MFSIKNNLKFLFLLVINFIASFSYGVRMQLLKRVDSAFADVIDSIPFNQAVKSGIITERINIEYNEQIYKDRTSIASILYLIDSLKSKPAQTTEVRGFEQRSAPQILITNGAISVGGSAGAAVTITLATGDKKYLIPEQTLELMGNVTSAAHTKYVKIASIHASLETISVVPIDPLLIIGTAAGTGFPDQTKVFITGSAFAQNSGSVQAVTVLPNMISNVTQIIRTPIELSASAAKERMYGETERARLIEQARFRHLIECSNTLLFNGPKVVIKQSTTESIHRGYMQGMENWILNSSPNVIQYDGTTAFIDEHDEWSNGLFSPKLIDGTQFKRFVLCNRQYRKYWTDLKKEKPGIEIGDNKTYGIPGVQRVVSADGEFDIMVDPSFEERYPYADGNPAAMALHLKYLEHRPYRKTILKANIQNPDTDGVKDEFITEFTWLGFLPELHGLIRPLPV